ncbi:MAG TPA: hypothetical protein VKD90_13980, partial [Gemmataceae bacterium]|nr:hypothetical protein [Gemmataceae bacterium]
TRSNVAGRAIRAWVDTGAPITVFPELVWRAFQSDVTLFQRPRGAPVRNVHIAGQTHPYRLGRVSMGVLDPDVVADDRLDPTLASLAPRPVVAQFLFDRGTYTDLPLIGLWGSVTDGRHLRQTFQLGQTHNVLWWLSEA